ncbi:MAG TPA: SemiSWEET transporter [Longimicrobiaceae bacterium]|jgi:MtN3 and saliva related transmembrane protein
MLEYLGYAAGVLTVLSFLPQVIRAWKTKKVNDLSFGMFALLITAGVLWIAYGVGSTDWPVIATNAGMVTLNCAILAAKIRFRGSAPER